MTQVLPAIIPRSKQQLEEEISKVSGFAKLVQVDISDGIFTRVKTWPYNGRDLDFFEQLKKEEVGWPKWQEVEYELHLMIQNPEHTIADWIHTGVSAIVVHIEATHDMQMIIDVCHESGVKVGIAIKPSTNIDLLDPFVEQVHPVRDREGSQRESISNGADFIQVMGNDELGKHGVELDPVAIERIKTLREKYPERIIAIDIGVMPETEDELRSAGVTKFVSGGALLNARDPEEVYDDLETPN